MSEAADRPAFYALREGGWRDLVTLLHPPYTAWLLSYVALGAAAAPELHPVRLWAALGAFFLAVGVAAHALDELKGHPLRTRLSDRTLWALAIVGLGGAVTIGIAGLFVVSASLAPFVVAGALMVLAYNLELFGGRFHTDFWFAAAWGAFPALTGFWVNALGIHSLGEAVAGAVSPPPVSVSASPSAASRPRRASCAAVRFPSAASSGSPTAPPVSSPPRGLPPRWTAPWRRSPGRSSCCPPPWSRSGYSWPI